MGQYYTQPNDRGSRDECPYEPCMAKMQTTDVVFGLKPCVHVCVLPKGHKRPTHLCISCEGVERRDSWTWVS